MVLPFNLGVSCKFYHQNLSWFIVGHICICKYMSHACMYISTFLHKQRRGIVRIGVS